MPNSISFRSKKPKNVILGFDISSKIVGVTAVDSITGECVFIEPIILDKDYNLIEKADAFEVELCKIITKYNVEVFKVGFEDFAQRFTVGKSSIKTILTLARFNILVEYIVTKLYKKPVIKFNVRTIRKRLGIVTNKDIGDIKIQIYTQVSEWLMREEKFDPPWYFKYPTRGKNKGNKLPHECNFDMADSWVVAKATFLDCSK